MSAMLIGGERRRVMAQLILSLALAAAFLNPFVERLEYGNALVFMFSHYALFIVGFSASYRLISLNRWAVVPGAFLSVFWHMPVPFAMSGAIFIFRLVEEASLIASGLLIGAAVHEGTARFNSLLLLLWFISDTALSVLFLISPGTFSSVMSPASPFPASQFIITGVAMIFFMNAVIAFVVYRYVRKFRPILLSEDN